MNKSNRIRDIPISEIDEFSNHPFKVQDDDDMIQLVESIKARGVITPAIVRHKEDGRYELISGHRRKRACEIVGLDTLKCDVKELSRDEAIICMVDSNLQRSVILPSEKAFAYKMRLEAMKRKAGRPSKDNSVPVAQNFEGKTSRELLAEQVGESQDQIRRLIRLTNLVPELLEFVDEGRIKMRPAVELSYLSKEFQQNVVDEIEFNECTPSHAQTIRMRKFFNEGKLAPEIICSIMAEEKPNQKEKILLRGDKIKKLIPKSVSSKDAEDFVVKALEYYNRYLQRSKEKER